MEIKMSSPDINEADRKAVMEVLDSRWLSMGPKVQEFEEKFADYIGVKHAIAVNSGTSGLLLANKVVNDDISWQGIRYTTPFSFVASRSTMPGNVYFADVNEATLNLDHAPGHADYIVAVDVFGQPFDRDRYWHARHTKFIEDACEAIGAEYKGRKAGTLGDISVFAFYPNKQMTTGEGGMICTNNDKWAELCRSLRNQGRDGGWFDHVRIGYNYRMDEMSAALGISQLARIDELLEKREQVAHWYTERLKDRIELLYISPNTTRMSWFVYPVFSDNRDELAERLTSAGIPSREYFKPIHLMLMYNYPEGSFPIAERAGRRCLALPFSGVMTEKEVDYVCKFV